MIQIKKYLAQIRLVFCPRAVEEKTALSGRGDVHESSWAGQKLPPRSGHVAPMPSSSSGSPCILGEVTGEECQVSAFASTEGQFCLGDTKPKGLGQEVQGQMTHSRKLVTA